MKMFSILFTKSTLFLQLHRFPHKETANKLCPTAIKLLRTLNERSSSRSNVIQQQYRLASDSFRIKLQIPDGVLVLLFPRILPVIPNPDALQPIAYPRRISHFLQKFGIPLHVFLPRRSRDGAKHPFHHGQSEEVSLQEVRQHCRHRQIITAFEPQNFLTVCQVLVRDILFKLPHRVIVIAVHSPMVLHRYLLELPAEIGTNRLPTAAAHVFCPALPFSFLLLIFLPCLLSSPPYNGINDECIRDKAH